MTGESRGETTPWVEANGMAYPYAFDPGLRTMDWFRQRGFPSAVLIDAAGRVAWKGHPASLDDETIAKAIEGALPQPVFELEGWPAVRELLDEERYGDAHQRIDATEGEALRERLRGGVDRILARRMQDLEELWGAGDYLAVKERCEVLEKLLGDLPQAEQVELWLSDMRKVRDIRDVVRAQEKVRDMIPEGRIKQSQREKLIKDLNKLAERFPDTVVERDVREAIARISGY